MAQPQKTAPAHAFNAVQDNLQDSAIKQIKTSIMVGNRRIVLKAPCAFGKTTLAAKIIKSGLDRGSLMLFVADAILLVGQTIKKFAAAGINDVGVIQADHPMTDSSKPVQICSVQTLTRRHVPFVDFIILDEAHVQYELYSKLMADPQWQDVIFIGLTATPYARGMGLHYTDMIVAATKRELIDKQILSPVRVFCPSKPDLKKIGTVGDDYNKKDLSKRMRRKQYIADAIDAYVEKGEGRSAVFFTVDRAHAKEMQKEIQALDITCGYIDGKTPLEEREEIEERHKAGNLQVVVNIGVLCKGIDWPWISCIVICRPTKSMMLAEQIIGRGMRMWPGKENLLILDCSGMSYMVFCHVNGQLEFITDVDREYDKLDDGKKNRTKRERKLPEPTECPKCKFLKPAGLVKCPNCDFKPERQNHVAGVEVELVEFNGKKKPPTMEEKREFYAEIKGLYNQKYENRFKPGWPAVQYKKKFKVWPNHPSIRNVEPKEPGEKVLKWVKSRWIAYGKMKEKEKC